MNIIDKVTGNRIANDIHTPLINMFDSLVNKGFNLPDSVSEDEYQLARNFRDNDPLKGFIGFGCSYSGKWFGGYARGNDSNGNARNYCLESKKNILKQVDSLKGVEFMNLKYNLVDLPAKSIVYCDPPYQGTTSYKDKFNHDHFWDYCRQMVLEGHSVYVSEYNAPDDFCCVWKKTVNNTLTKNTGSKQGIERLFIHKSQYK